MDVNQQDWMSALPEELWDIPLTELAIPGSHDAMSYCLDITSPLLRSESDFFWLLDGLFYCVTRPLIFKWATTQIVRLAVYGMLPRNLHRRTMMQRLHIFPEDELPDDIRANLTEELPQPREIPRKLSEYTQEEIDAFPRLWIPPEDYKMK